MSEWVGILLIFAAYFMGSIPFGLLIAHKKGVDVRVVGSGNIGATNVARNLGKRTGSLVLLLDVLKSALPTLVARGLIRQGELEIEYLAIVALAAILGHCYSIWLRFRGGKGVATALGVFLVVDPVLASIGIAIFVGIYGAFRIASIGSVSAAIAFPFLLWLSDRPPALVHLGIAVATIIVIKHRKNLLRVFHGQENKV